MTASFNPATMKGADIVKGLIETKKVAVYTTSDGKTFDNKDKAMKHQAEINLRGFFLSSVDGNEATAALVAQSILDDLDGFREVLGPLVRKPRGSKAVETVAESARVGVGGAAGLATPQTKTKAA